MAVPRQDPDDEMLQSGRVNQKRRTRMAILEAATKLLQDGVTPTVAQAAESAAVSRTTAYRYFPTQESLLMELTLSAGVSDLDQRAMQPLDGEAPEARLLEVLHDLNRVLLTDETTHRAALRLYLDQWLDSAAEGREIPHLREGRRRRWIAHALDDMKGVSAKDKRRLTAALSLVVGIEAIVTLRDVCHLEADEVVAVTDWAAKALLDAALEGRR